MYLTRYRVIPFVTDAGTYQHIHQQIDVEANEPWVDRRAYANK